MSANPNRPVAMNEPRIVEPVPIKLDDQTRTLRMDFRAMKLIEKKTGRVMWRGEAWDFDSLTPDDLSYMVWACLLHESPDITQDEVDMLPGMTLGNFNYLLGCLSSCWGEAMPTPEQTEGDAASQSTGPKDEN